MVAYMRLLRNALQRWLPIGVRSWHIFHDGSAQPRLSRDDCQSARGPIRGRLGHCPRTAERRDPPRAARPRPPTLARRRNLPCVGHHLHARIDARQCENRCHPECSRLGSALGSKRLPLLAAGPDFRPRPSTRGAAGPARRTLGGTRSAGTRASRGRDHRHSRTVGSERGTELTPAVKRPRATAGGPGSPPFRLPAQMPVQRAPINLSTPRARSANASGPARPRPSA